MPSRHTFKAARTDAAIDDKKNGSSPSASVPSPGPVVNQLDDTARETFATGRPLEDSPDLQQCKHCKKSILKTAAKAHIAQCLKLKKEKAQRKKEAREARERAKEAAREEEARKADGDRADTKDDVDSDGDDDGPADKKATGSKTAKKAAGKKLEDDKKGKKRKADGDPDKGPKTKKKKDEPKPKVPKPKGSCAHGGLAIVSCVQVTNKSMNPRTGRCRATMWRDSTERPALCAVSDMQKSLYGCKARGSRAISTLRHAPRGVPEEKPSQATK